MLQICFATNNINKVKEIKNVLGDRFEVLSLSAVNCLEELPETGDTLSANSLQKASYLKQHYNVNCFADDTGLEIEALNGEPGVYSARYAGDQKDNIANIALVLRNLEGKTNRKACFKTVITLLWNNEMIQFEGRVDGQINQIPVGENGFGYDAIFVPNGYTTTFAQMTMEQKNAISHRAIAFNKLLEYLNKPTLL
ncbi:MAG: RdgB/HAM1 family non-canonical purine NTP pyrophosphatase [Pseudarcicella sp.]|nr:RdgB/HAM1 family non-canonical purine NTP pyrophosphatase [Pseudarcicella sp.]MBP6410600.1 RdgB/HAM1 family non-canonical purine NTP pyrophosphatase [Pseudarcicella sp.]